MEDPAPPLTFSAGQPRVLKDCCSGGYGQRMATCPYPLTVMSIIEAMAAIFK